MTTGNDDPIATFLDAVPAGRREHTEAALRLIAESVAAGSPIFNVDFKDAKLVLDRSAEAAWEGRTSSFWVGKGNDLDTDAATNNALNEMNRAVRPYGCHGFIAAEKKMAQVTVTHPMVEAYRNTVAVIVPVAKLLEAAKGLVVKGRKPNPEAAARKAARMANEMLRATCACCFNKQAVLPNGKIHDHGYSLPHRWMKTSSCPGRRFRPLEVSSDGLVFMVNELRKTERNTVQTIERLEGKTGLNAEDARKNQAHLQESQSDLQAIRSDLATFTKALAEWKAPPAAPRTVMRDGLYRVTTSYLCAGFVVQGGGVVSYAPILGRKLHFWVTIARWVCD